MTKGVDSKKWKFYWQYWKSVGLLWQQPCGFYLIHLMIFLGLLNMVYHPSAFFIENTCVTKTTSSLHRRMCPLNSKLDGNTLTCLYGWFPLNPVARALPMCDIYSFAIDYYFSYVLCMKESNILGIPECLKHAQRDVPI